MEGFWLYFKKMLNVIIFIAQVLYLYTQWAHTHSSEIQVLKDTCM
jgi:hypothetical protein